MKKNDCSFKILNDRAIGQKVRDGLDKKSKIYWGKSIHKSRCYREKRDVVEISDEQAIETWSRYWGDSLCSIVEEALPINCEEARELIPDDFRQNFLVDDQEHRIFEINGHSMIAQVCPSTNRLTSLWHLREKKTRASKLKLLSLRTGIPEKDLVEEIMVVLEDTLMLALPK